VPRHLAVRVGYLPTPSHIPNVPLDDPNPDFDGVEGRLPVSPNPVPSGYPTPWTTGLRGLGIDVASLTPHAGGVTFNTPGQVIEGYDFAESVHITGPNITLRRCRVTSSDFFPVYTDVTAPGAIIEDCRIRSVGSNPARVVGLEGDGTIMRRCDTSGGADNVGLSANNLVVEDCYIAGAYYVALLPNGDSSHNDCFQSAGGSNVTIRRCSVIGTWRDQTSCCLFKADATNITGVTLQSNYFSGGNQCLIFYDMGAGRMVSGVVMTDNRFELDSWNIAAFPDISAYKSVEQMAASFIETGTLVIPSP